MTTALTFLSSYEAACAYIVLRPYKHLVGWRNRLGDRLAAYEPRHDFEVEWRQWDILLFAWLNAEICRRIAADPLSCAGTNED